MKAVIIKQNNPFDNGELYKVDVDDIHQIESGDTMIAEGNLVITLKDLKTTFETYSPIRFSED